MVDVINMENGIMQRPISEHAYRVMMTIKDAKGIDGLQEYFMDYLGNKDNLSMNNLYKLLTSVAFELLSKRDLENIIEYDIMHKLEFNKFMHNKNSIDSKDLVEILMTKISLLQVREQVGNKYVDLFLVDCSGRLYNMDDYDKIEKIKVKRHE